MKRKFRWYWIGLVVTVVALLVVGSFFKAARSKTASTELDDANWQTAPGVYKVVTGRTPSPAIWPKQKVTQVPATPADYSNPFAVDFRWADLTGLDLSNSGALLTDFATFSTRTVWPAQMPSDFAPTKIMALGKDPGLGIHQLHAAGITGKGVKVAILDQPLLRGHQEYASQVTSYTEVGWARGSMASMHGPAVTSLLAGKSVGVAPDATVEYYAIEFASDAKNTPTFRPMAQTINQILDQNAKLPKPQQVRVISASIQANPGLAGYDELQKAYQRAISDGVLVLTVDMWNRYPYALAGLGRDLYADPNDYHSYVPGQLGAKHFYDHWMAQAYSLGKVSTMSFIWAPMDARTVADPTGNGAYTFFREGGLSWLEPYMAGVYALVLQVNPDVTPDQFLQAAYDTGDYTTVRYQGTDYKLGPIVAPQALVNKFRK